MSYKILLGIVLLFVGAWLMLPLGTGLPLQGATWDDFQTAVKGLLPPLLVFFGALALWIESEDRKAK